MQEKLEQIVLINRQMKELEEKRKTLQQELIEWWLKKWEYDWASVSLTVRQTPKLKEDVDITELELTYPEFLKFDATSFAKTSYPDGYIEIHETSYLTIKEWKK